jgi:hypothetical protein
MLILPTVLLPSCQGYNPELPNGGLPPPDPERWLPKWQRSEFKKKKLKSAQREKAAVKGSQVGGLGGATHDPGNCHQLPF